MTSDKWFQDTYDRMHKALQKRARSALRDVPELRMSADDFVQDVFAKLYANLESIRSHENVDAWLMAVLNHEIIDALRDLARFKRKLGTPVDLDSVAGLSDAESELFVRAIGMSDLLRRVLTEKELAVLALRYMTGYTYKEIAKELYMTVTNVAQTLFRAQRKLEKMLKHDEM